MIYQWYIWLMADSRDVEEGSSLAGSVYAELKLRLNRGDLAPGQFLDQAALGAELGMSRAPLRDALIRLELEGFVTIYPRRGVMVRPLDLATIRNIYEILGALEASAAEHAIGRFGMAEDGRMADLIELMDKSLACDDFDAYYEANVRFHDVYISLSTNPELRRQVGILKERLYDFPRRSSFVKEWELASMNEHRELASRFALRDFVAAAAWIREVHWSYEVQERFVRAYYADGGFALARRDEVASTGLVAMGDSTPSFVPSASGASGAAGAPGALAAVPASPVKAGAVRRAIRAIGVAP